MVEATTQLKTADWSDGSESPEVIRARLEQTRANMSEIMDKIQERLSPERLTEEAKQKVKEATIGKVEKMAHMATYKANTWRSQVVETVRHNPIPAALIGIGLGWLLIENARSSDEYHYSSPEHDYDTSRGMRYYQEQKPLTAKAQEVVSENMSNVQSKASEMTRNVQEKTGEVVETVQMKANEMAGTLQARANEVTGKAGEMSSNLQRQVGEQTDYLAHQAQYQAQRAKQGMQTTFDENPVAIGAVVLAAGAAIGLMIPITQKEDELMGDTRDRLLQQAQDVAKETFRKVEKGAEEAYQVVKEEVKKDTEQANWEPATPRTQLS